MSADDQRSNEQNDEADQTITIMNNDKFLNRQIAFLKEKYDYATVKDFTLMGRQYKFHEMKKDYRKLINRFPSKGSRSKELETEDYDYRVLTPLTLEQEQRIEKSKNEIERRFEKAHKESLKAVRSGISTKISEIEFKAFYRMWGCKLDIDFNN